MENMANPPLKKPSLSLSNTSRKVTITSEDVIISILNRLPLKSLMRFTLVSKRWRDMITNPRRPDSCYSLRRAFLRSSANRILSFVFTKTDSWGKGQTSWISYHHNNIPQQAMLDDMKVAQEACLGITAEARVVASSNGILLCIRRSYQPPREYFVYNPVTGQCVTLPKFRAGMNYYMGVGFDCQVIDNVMHYVVMVACCTNLRLLSYVGVFSSRDNEQSHPPRWRYVRTKIPCASFFDAIQLCFPVVVRRRIFYWMDFCGKLIMACNHVVEGSGYCWKIKTPKLELEHQAYFRDFDSYRIGVPMNSDSLYWGATMNTGEEFQLWIYNKHDHNDKEFQVPSKETIDVDNGHWELKHRISPRELAESHPEAFGDQRPEAHRGSSTFNFWGLHPSLPWIAFLTLKDKFFSYDFETNRLEVHSNDRICTLYNLAGLIEWLPWPYLLSEPH